MKVQLHHPNREQGFTIIAYLIFALVIMGTIAAVATYVIQNVNYGKRRQDFVNAYQFAQGGAVVACKDIEHAFTNSAGFMNSLAQDCCGSYSTNSSLSSASQLVLQRTVSSPFSNQTVAVLLKMTNTYAPTELKVLATAAVGNSSQTVEINLELKFAYGAAIISTSSGSSSTSASKSCAQDGNVVVDGSSGNTTWIEGGILSNGACNSNQCAVDSIAKNLYGTFGQIPDYTSPGSSDQLFNFDRFIAVADATPGGNNHFTNLTTFIAAAKSNTLEGVVVVDIKYGASNPNLDDNNLPNGINVRGTLVFNFCANSKGQNWDPLDKIVNTATMNINAANLTGFNASNATTFPTGYPPVYADTNKNPYSVTPAASSGFSKFDPSDDLPALMYNNAILDMHGNVNICGVVYSSSFMEIENKQSGQTQYFNGALIGGGGIYVENGSKATSVVRYDPNALDRLATSGTRGKTVRVVYQR